MILWGCFIRSPLGKLHQHCISRNKEQPCPDIPLLSIAVVYSFYTGGYCGEHFVGDGVQPFGQPVD